MNKYIKILLITSFIMGMIINGNAYVFWYPDDLEITAPRAVHVNSNNCSQSEKDRHIDAIQAWKWVGVTNYPYFNGETRRAPFSTDGMNVAGVYNGESNHLGLAQIMGNNNEVDIAVNTYDHTFYKEKNFHEIPATPEMYTFQGVATHKCGHLMGLGHTDDFFATMRPGCIPNTSMLVTLAADDIYGLTARCGLIKVNQWQVTYNSTGAEVTLSDNGVGVRVYLNPHGIGDDWGEPIVVTRSDIGGYVDENSRFEWIETDLDHATIISPCIIGVDGFTRHLYYAANAPDWYNNPDNIGWVNMDIPEEYNTGRIINRTIYQDHIDEYGVQALCVSGIRVMHFVDRSWQGDHGCYIGYERVLQHDITP